MRLVKLRRGPGPKHNLTIPYLSSQFTPKKEPPRVSGHRILWSLRGRPHCSPLCVLSSPVDHTGTGPGPPPNSLLHPHRTRFRLRPSSYPSVPDHRHNTINLNLGKLLPTRKGRKEVTGDVSPRVSGTPQDPRCPVSTPIIFGGLPFLGQVL